MPNVDAPVLYETQERVPYINRKSVWVMPNLYMSDFLPGLEM